MARPVALCDICSGNTLLARPTFLHGNTLAHPAGSTRSRRDNQSMRMHCWLPAVTKVNSAGRVTLLLDQGDFSPCKRGHSLSSGDP